MLFLLLGALLALVAAQLQPLRQGELVFAVHGGLWKIYDGGWLNAADGGSWTSKITGIKYYEDDKYCVSHNGYDCK